MRKIIVRVGVYIVVAAAVATFAVGCATTDVSSSRELVGMWTGTSTPDGQEEGMQVSFDMREDGTFTEKIQGTDIEFSGRYSVDGATSTLNVTVDTTSDKTVVPVGASFTQDVEISRDGQTFWATGGGSSGKFEKQ